MATKSPAVAIGLVVASVIREADLTLKEFGQQAGIPHVTLSRRINGHVPFTWPELVKVSDVTGVSLAEIADRAQRLTGLRESA